jgi:hypothetical protein
VGFWVGLFFVNIKFFVQLIHAVDIDEYQDYKNIDGALLGKPETKFESSDFEIVQLFDQKDAKSKGNCKPNQEQKKKGDEVLFPICFHFLLVVGHGFFDINFK